MLSGTGTTMSSLLFHSRLPDCPYEIVLVASNVPEARGLKIAEAEGIATFAHSHRGMTREAHEAVMDEALRAAGAEYLALAGYMRVLTAGFVQRWAGRNRLWTREIGPWNSMTGNFDGITIDPVTGEMRSCGDPRRMGVAAAV